MIVWGFGGLTNKGIKFCLFSPVLTLVLYFHQCKVLLTFPSDSPHLHSCHVLGANAAICGQYVMVCTSENARFCAGQVERA